MPRRSDFLESCLQSEVSRKPAVTDQTKTCSINWEEVKVTDQESRFTLDTSDHPQTKNRFYDFMCTTASCDRNSTMNKTISITTEQTLSAAGSFGKRPSKSSLAKLLFPRSRMNRCRKYMLMQCVGRLHII